MTADPETTTRAEARDRLPDRETPAFRAGDESALTARLDAVERESVRTLAASPGDRPVRLVAYGEREPVARGERSTRRWADATPRTHPVGDGVDD